MTLGEILKKARLEKGLTQKQLGNLCGMADSAIRRYENSDAKPKISTLRRITDALDIKLYDLGNDIWKYYSMEEIKEDFAESGQKIKITFSSKMPDSMAEYNRNRVTEIYDGLNDFGKTDAPKLLRAYSKLNNTGQYEALKRLNELSKIEGYRKGDPEYEPDKPQFD